MLELTMLAKLCLLLFPCFLDFNDIGGDTLDACDVTNEPSEELASRVSGMIFVWILDGVTPPELGPATVDWGAEELTLASQNVSG